MTKILADFKNENDGVKATVAEYYKGGFSVALFDIDAEAAIPVAKIFKAFDDAIAYAKKIANA